MNIVFWHSYLMFHQAAYIRELANIPGNTVHWCVDEALPRRFRDRGYPVPDTGQVQVHVAPTPEQIADELQRWFENGAADGFNILVPHLPGGLEDFANGVVPELQRRGLFRTEYEGRTLRQNLGLARPQNRFV